MTYNIFSIRFPWLRERAAYDAYSIAQLVVVLVFWDVVVWAYRDSRWSVFHHGRRGLHMRLGHLSITLRRNDPYISWFRPRSWYLNARGFTQRMIRLLRWAIGPGIACDRCGRLMPREQIDWVYEAGAQPFCPSCFSMPSILMQEDPWTWVGQGEVGWRWTVYRELPNFRKKRDWLFGWVQAAYPDEEKASR